MSETRQPEIEHLEALVKQRMRARDARERALRLRVAAFAAFFSVGGLLFAGYGVLSQLRTIPKRPSVDLTWSSIRRLQADVDGIKRSVGELRTAVAAFQKLPHEAMLANTQVRISSQLEVIETRLSGLEAAILESPERAMSIPLLRKDISDVARRTDENRVAMKSDMDRLYAQQTWMLGGIGTVLLAIAGGAVTIILKSLPGSKKTEDEA